jgi:hypothetical protein
VPHGILQVYINILLYENVFQNPVIFGTQDSLSPEQSLKVNFTSFLASNLLAQFSFQIVIQILGLESKMVCGNLALLPFR